MSGLLRVAFRGSSRVVDPTKAVLIGADGLDASAVEAQTEEYATMDGARLAGVRASRRDIRLRYSLLGDPEEARQEIYRQYEPKTSGTLYLTTSKRASTSPYAMVDRTLTAEATVAGVDFDPWARSQVMEVHLVCPDPWLYGQTKTVELTDSNRQWTTENDGMAVGFTAQVGRAGYVRTKLTAIDGYERRVTWDASSVLASDAVLTLDTRDGHWDLYIEANGVRTSYIQYITEWDFDTIPHGTRGVRTTAGKGPLVFTERWLGI